MFRIGMSAMCLICHTCSMVVACSNQMFPDGMFLMRQIFVGCFMGAPIFIRMYPIGTFQMHLTFLACSIGVSIFIRMFRGGTLGMKAQMSMVFFLNVPECRICQPANGYIIGQVVVLMNTSTLRIQITV